MEQYNRETNRDDIFGPDIGYPTLSVILPNNTRGATVCPKITSQTMIVKRSGKPWMR